MPLPSGSSSSSGQPQQQRERRRRHHHHHHHPSSTSATTTRSGGAASDALGAGGGSEAVTLTSAAGGIGVGGNGHEVTVRYSQNNGVEMNGNSGGYSRKSKSQSPDVTTSWFEVSSSARNGSAGGQAWRLAKVFNENDEALINRKLPKELLLRVFSHLDVVSLCRCAQVRHN